MSTIASGADLLPIEREVCKIVKTRRIRIAEFFKDFDRLRSGKISQHQFTRSLNQVLGSARSDAMKPAEEDALVKKYKDADDMIDYRAFSNAIDTPFDPDVMAGDCKQDSVGGQNVEYLGVKNQVSENSLDNVVRILSKLEPYYDYRGVDLRRCFEDFARHNNGLITASQFNRSFPGKDTITSDDIRVLAEYYKDPFYDGDLVNYLNFHLDIYKMRNFRKTGKEEADETSPIHKQLYKLKIGTEEDDTVKMNIDNLDPEMKNVFERLHVAIFKNRIRSTEFFRDNDKLRSGIITRNQFIRGLTSLLSTSLFTAKEINKIADVYSTPDGMVKYRQFCYTMENTFNIPDLERQPTLEPVRPDPKNLQTKLAKLTSHEESQLEKLIQEIRQYVAKRRIMLYPYFKDFDRGAGYTRTVTRGQFSRILNFSGINLTPSELDLVNRKYRDPITGDVLYPAFSVAVEAEFTEYIKSEKDAQRYGIAIESFQEQVSKKSDNTKDDRLVYVKKPTHLLKNPTNSIQNILAQITQFIYRNRIRGEEFFLDFDPLRSNIVTRSVFLRCLDSMGITNLSQNEASNLADHYQDVKKTDCVRWQNFLKDVTTLHSSADDFINKCGYPSEPIPPKAIIPGKSSFDSFNDEERVKIFSLLQRWKGRAERRRLLMKPVFQDFDKHNHGYVTPNQFRQVLCLLQLKCTESDAKLIIKLFSDKVGFNYAEFISILDPKIVEQTKYQAQLEELQSIGKKTTKQATGMHSEMHQAIIAKTNSGILKNAMSRLKTRIFKERIRVYEWCKDYDKLRSGSIKRSSFRRAMDLCGVNDVLVEPEIVAIMDHYTNVDRPENVCYLRLCEELESVFTTPELDKHPTMSPVQFKPPIEWEKNDLEAQEEAIFHMAMVRLGEHVHKTRIQLYPLFEDYDRVHNATVSRSQFHRVLSELEMGGLLSEQEFRVIFKKYNMTRGGKNDVNYIAFCDWFKDRDERDV